MTVLHFLILALAAFRIARVVIEDTIAQPIRTSILSRWPGQDVKYEADDPVRGGTVAIGNDLYAVEPTWIGDRLAKLLGCYACTGFWISLLLTLAYWLWPVPVVWLMFPFALSGSVWILALIQDRLEKD